MGCAIAVPPGSRHRRRRRARRKPETATDGVGEIATAPVTMSDRSVLQDDQFHPIPSSGAAAKDSFPVPATKVP